MSREINPSSAGRIWTWCCPVCNARFGGSMLRLSEIRLDHLRTCVPPDTDDTIGVVRSKKWRRRDYDR